MALNKRQKAIQAAVEPGKAYPIDDALKIIKGFNKAKFVEAVDVAVRLGVDARKSDQQVRGSTVLPAGTGKSVRVAVFAPAGAKADEALAAGAEAVKNAKSGQVRYRTDKAGIIHATIGKADFGDDALKSNLQALLLDLIKAKPATSKGQYLQKISLSSTMGPGVTVDQASLALK